MGQYTLGPSPVSTLRDIPLFLQPSDFTLNSNTGKYEATFTNTYITAASKDYTILDESYRNVLHGDLKITKVTENNSVALKFIADAIPTGNLEGTISSIAPDDGKVCIVIENTVTPIVNGGTGANTVAGAQNNLGLVPTTATNVTQEGYVADARAIKTLNDNLAVLSDQITVENVSCTWNAALTSNHTQKSCYRVGNLMFVNINVYSDTAINRDEVLVTVSGVKIVETAGSAMVGYDDGGVSGMFTWGNNYTVIAAKSIPVHKRYIGQLVLHIKDDT